MTNEERFKKYIQEQCVNCKNRDTDLCEIRISKANNSINTKCIYYEKGKELQGYKKQLIRTAKQGKALMRLNI